jgi:hypothetical protein
MYKKTRLNKNAVRRLPDSASIDASALRAMSHYLVLSPLINHSPNLWPTLERQQNNKLQI